jgi:prepilin-type N-terminal cleavage/methylation domain-containing protein/prepilin-type processing-associated H-X9-DG protein
MQTPKRLLAVQKHTRGFTLVELLVVIAIISILAAILFPVLAKARARARCTSCATHMQQIGAALLMYAQDFDERLPRPWWFQEVEAGIWPGWYKPDASSPSGGWCYCGWERKIGPYLASHIIFVCPDDFFLLNRADPWGQPRLPQDDTSYGINAAACSYSALADFDRPGETILVAETKGWHRADYTRGGGDPREVDHPADLFMCDGQRHHHGANYVFVDGHVKWLPPSATLAPVNLWRRDK